MAVKDIESTRTLLPQLFDHKRGDVDWVDGWTVGPIENPEGIGPQEIDGWIANAPSNWPESDTLNRVGSGSDDSVIAVYRTGEIVPGMPLKPSARTTVPPTDSWAFYLPFHYFSGEVWGIYLFLGGIETLKRRIEHVSRHSVNFMLATRSARRFLYFHELFHHQVESAALRLETERRRPWYRTGFEALYRDRLAAGAATEEAIANAHAIEQTVARARKEGASSGALTALRDALLEIADGMPPSYRDASRFLGSRAFDAGCNALLEESRARCLRTAPGNPDVWNANPYLLRGMATIKSRVNWIARDGRFPGAGLTGLSRLVSRTKFERALNRHFGLEYVSNKGKHEKWAVEGIRVAVPRHKVLKTHTAQGILKQLKLGIRLEELLAM